MALHTYQIWLFYAGVILHVNVTLKSELSHIMVSTKDKIKFMAQFTPRLAGEDTVSYKLYRSDWQDPLTGGPEFRSNFPTAGRYLRVSFLLHVMRNSLLTWV